jgi:membrane-anchored mycosin MYCP
MLGRRTWAAALAAVVLGSTLVVAAPGPAAADACGDAAGQPGDALQNVPWPQQQLDPERVWPFATGAGQTVALVDTGVDGGRDQLQGRVLAGWDTQTNQPDNNVDCSSHGTALASLIAAQPDSAVGYQGVPFHGIAKDVKILPIRISDVDPSEDAHGTKQPGSDKVAQAINWATQHGATVIEVSNAFDSSDDGLKAAVQRALAAGIPVVAAVGDEHNPNLAEDSPTYPAAYPGVIGVGAIDQEYARIDKSNVGPYVSVMAPGDSVPAATRIAGFTTWTGTSVAAGLVAGVVALVRQAWPQLTPEQVAERITATADPAPGGQYGPAYGHGIVDAYRAVTEQVSNGHPVPLSGVTKQRPSRASVVRARWWHWTETLSLGLAGVIGFGLLLLVAFAVILPRGRRRGWLPARAPRPVTPSPELADDVDDQKLFEVPKPHREAEPVEH